MNQPPFAFFRAGMVFSGREMAGHGQRFERDAFTGSIGKIVPVRVHGEIIGHARVREAEVADDGSSVQFTYEVTDLSPGQPGDLSIPG